jgi:hypothetical protein
MERRIPTRRARHRLTRRHPAAAPDAPTTHRAPEGWVVFPNFRRRWRRRAHGGSPRQYSSAERRHAHDATPQPATPLTATRTPGSGSSPGDRWTCGPCSPPASPRALARSSASERRACASSAEPPTRPAPPPATPTAPRRQRAARTPTSADPRAQRQSVPRAREAAESSEAEAAPCALPTCPRAPERYRRAAPSDCDPAYAVASRPAFSACVRLCRSPLSVLSWARAAQSFGLALARPLSPARPRCVPGPRPASQPHGRGTRPPPR